MLERIAKDPHAFIRQQGWASVSLDPEHGLMELRSLYEHLQAKILELIESLDELRAIADYEVFEAAKEDESVIGRIVAVQQEVVEREMAWKRRPVRRSRKSRRWWEARRFRSG